MSIIIFGGTGYLGIPLIKSLKKQKEIKIMTHKTHVENLSVKKFSGNLLKKKSFENKLNENDIVINLVGQATVNYSELVTTNIDGGLNLLNACIKKKVKRIILISSINVYGENLKKASVENDFLKPETNYGRVKMLTEMMYKYFSEYYNIDITVLRLSNLYGENKKDGFLSKLLNSPKEKLKPHNFGNQQLDVLYIKDAIEGIIQTLNTDLKGFNIINISSGKRYSIKEMIGMIEKISNKKILVEYVEQKDSETCIWANNLKAKKILNFEPKYSIKEGFELAIQSNMKN